MMTVTYGKGFAPVVPWPLVSIDADSGEIRLPCSTVEGRRAWIVNLTESMLAMPGGDKVDFPVEHSFKDGMYMRKLFIPKGSVIVGKIHRLDCLNIVARGDMSIVTESGSARVQAGYTVTSPAGIQKVGYAHEDTVFINVFRTDCSDEALIDDVVAYPSYAAAQQDLIAHKEAACQLHG